MTTAMRTWETRAARGTFTRALVLLLATLGVLATTATPTAAQLLKRGPVMNETHHTDLAGNIRLSTNEAGDVTQRLDYAPFGEVDGRSCTGDGDPTRSPQFQGKLRDPKTCLDDFGARDYYRARVNARGAGAVVGGAITAVVAGGPAAWRAAVGCFLSPSCPAGTVEVLEGLAGGAPRVSGVGGLASSAANGIRLARLLASEAGEKELLSGGGRVMAGAGSQKSIRDINQLVAQYGGKPGDWAKITSSSYKIADGSSIEVHAYKNTVTNLVYETKSILEYR